MKKIYTLVLMALLLWLNKVDAGAVSFPSINVSFETTDESVIVDGVPGNSADGLVEYMVEGYLNYQSERIETFCYGPNVVPYDVPDKMAYIFNWSGDAEFLLPCTGEYQFTAWGPGLPNTTVESYDLGQIKGKDKAIRIEEETYTWTIKGQEIVNVPGKNISLKIAENPESFDETGVSDFFGETIALKMNIEHSGEFGFSAVLDYKIGAEYIGKYANLFYVAGGGAFEYIDGSLVGDDGVASFVMIHASDYVVAITDVEYTGQELNVKEEIVTTEEPTVEPEKVENVSSEQNTESVASEEKTESVTNEKTTETSVTESSTETTATEITQATVSIGSSILLVVGGAVLIALVMGVVLAIKKKK